MARIQGSEIADKRAAYQAAMNNRPKAQGVSEDGGGVDPFVADGSGGYTQNPWLHAYNTNPWRGNVEVPNAEGGTSSVPGWQAADTFSASLAYPMYNMISEQLSGLQKEFTDNLERTSDLGWRNIAEVTETKAHTFDERKGGRGSRSYRA